MHSKIIYLKNYTIFNILFQCQQNKSLIDKNVYINYYKNMIKIMFVCHGNICRSPMAEFILKDMVKRQNLQNNFIICSSATSTEEIWNGIGNPVYPPAKKVLEHHGINPVGKQAVQLKKSDYNKYDLFIGMDSANIKNMKRIFDNNSNDKIHKLMEYTGSTADVFDPWYTRNFEKCYNDIFKGCEALLKTLI